MERSRFSLGTQRQEKEVEDDEEEGGWNGVKGCMTKVEEHLMRLLGFNQYGIWLEDDWKTNLIWEAIRLSFITRAVSRVD